MRMRTVLSAFGVMLFAALSVFAQDKPGTLAALEFQKPKSGMAPQYEAGRKQKAAWHKQQKDPQPLLVWETLSGDHTGTYIVGRLGQHWSDFDKPAVPDQADLEEFQKVLGTYVDSIVSRYYDFMPKVSNPDSSAGRLPSSPRSSPSMCATAKDQIFGARSAGFTTRPKRQSGPSITNGTCWPTAATRELMCSFCRAPTGQTSRTNLT